MNPTQNNQAGQHDYVKEHSGHHFKRKWHDSLHSEQTELTGDGDAHVIKAAHTGPSDGDNTHVEEDDEELKAKRKAQNREAQRSFRLRKEKYVKDLEMKIKQAQDNHMFATHQLYQENHHLRAIIYRLEAENTTLKGMMPLPDSNKPLDLFSSLGLPSLPPLSSFYTPAPVEMPPPIPCRSSPIYPKHLAAKLPVPILPQQPKQPQAPIITAESLHPKPLINTNDPPPQEFTFSISTPATLRAHTQGRATQSDPIELVPLYHPDHSLQSTDSSPSVKSPCDTTTNTKDHTSPFASFLDGYDAFERLYVHQDPALFDDPGLDLVRRRDSVAPTITAKDDMVPVTAIGNKTMEGLVKDKSTSGSPSVLPLQQQQVPPQQPPRQAINITVQDDEKTPIWQKITEHAQNNKFSVDHLVEAVRNTTTSKRKNKLLVDEWELEAMVHDLNYYL